MDFNSLTLQFTPFADPIAGVILLTREGVLGKRFAFTMPGSN